MEIVPSDFERTISFYTELFGFKIKQRRKVERPPLKEILFAELNDSVIEFIDVENPTPVSTGHPQVGYLRIAFEVEDMDNAIEYLKTRGVKISREPVDLGTSKRAEIEDPDGLSIELRQWL